MPSARWELILFDLGGVLLEFDAIGPLVDLSGETLSHQEAKQAWLTSRAVQRFETGQCGPEEFASAFLSELVLPIEPVRFLDLFVSWERGPMNGAIELLQSLRRGYRLACLSNNNELHWRIVRDKFGFDRLFHRCYLSYEIGVMKPDPRIYGHVLADQDLSPDRVLFFDDSPQCVGAARDLGISAHQASGVTEVREVLRSLDVLA
ncbi:MAG: HAD family hydrolase [Planctomycetota bacterium]